MNATGRGWMKGRPARTKIIAVFLETLMAILHSTTVKGRIAGCGYDGSIVSVVG